MRYIPIVKFFSEEFVDVRPAAAPADDDETHLADALLAEIADEQQALCDARIEEEIKALRKWDVL